MIALTLTTERLVLRMPQLSDFEPRAAHAASERSIWEGGPLDRIAAWRIFASDVGQWALMGYGPFSIVGKDTGAYLGEAGIYHAQDYPEPELGWFVVPEAEGKGVAAEAASAIMLWACRTFGWDRLVSYIDPGNTRSIALALRLGGVVDPKLPGQDPTDIVVRHDLRGLA
jgi:RimJ/RimL family protein N-acetyltransferase